MDNKPHDNFLKSSNCIFVSFALGLINLFMTRDELVTGEQKGLAMASMLFVLGLGFLVRQGFNWTKYLLLVLFIVGLLGIPVTIMHLQQRPVVGVISVIQTVLAFLSMFILFRIPKTVEENPVTPGSRIEKRPPTTGM